MGRIILLSLLLLILGKEALASLSVPDQLFGVRKITRDFRLPIKNKLLQLRQNFIERRYQQGTRFISNETVLCPLGIQVMPKASLVDYRYTTRVERKDNKVISYENRFLRGCNQEDSLVERIKVVGDRAFLSSEDMILQGEFHFKMVEGKESIDYRILDSSGVQVMRIFSKITGGDRVTRFFLGDEEFIQILYKKRKGFLDVRYLFYGINFNLNRNGYVYRTHIAARSQGYFRALIYDNGAIEYFNDKNVQVSLASFQKNFTLNGISFIMDSLFMELPATQFVSSGNQSARLIEELRNAQSWLITGNPSQLNLVKNLVDEYIKAAQNGLLIDKRPNKQ